uniref:BHLH domain-containing protein n=1 Tax=Globodera rostochiensis TaxID=31243 RepID=A0A914I070_GLORO
MSQSQSNPSRKSNADNNNGIGRRMQKGRRRQRIMAIRRSIGQPQRSSSSSSSEGEVCPSSSKLPISTRATQMDSERALSSEEMRELGRLATLLPPSLRVLNPQANPAQLVLNASHYIAQLTSTVLARVHNGTLPGEALGQLLSGVPSHPAPRPQPTPRRRIAIHRYSWMPSRRKQIVVKRRF